MANNSVTLTNTHPGPRGVNTTSGYVEVAPGKSVSVELVDAELQSAQDMGCFDIVGVKAAPAGKAPPAPPAPPAASAAPPAASAAPPSDDALPSNPLKLKQLAKVEGIDVGAATKAVDLKAAIVAGRAAKADQAPLAPDTLDDMDDETLRNTVAAITGKPVAELADQERAALLALARGE